MRRFHDREEGGRVLAEALRHLAGRGDVVVLGLPRGGVPVAYQVAQALEAPLDVFVVRKLGVPGHPELAMGAIASGGVRVMNDAVVRELAIPQQAIDRVAEDEQRELQRRERMFRGDRAAPEVAGRVAVLVDDGLATGSTMRAAVAALRKLAPSRIVVAVPVGAREACEEFGREVDEVVCAQVPDYFRAVGLWYEDFEQTGDEEVRELLARAARAPTH
ncbi:MAG TPA: phosphoribosyltransferase [Usitatibacter sp.]|nr:phosphoribosyltransferase [Usitatibacter sp.]